MLVTLCDGTISVQAAETAAPAPAPAPTLDLGDTTETLQELRRDIEDKQDEMNAAVANQKFLEAANLQKQVQELKDNLIERAQVLLQGAIDQQNFVAAAKFKEILTEFGGTNNSVGKIKSAKPAATSRPARRRPAVLLLAARRRPGEPGVARLDGGAARRRPVDNHARRAHQLHDPLRLRHRAHHAGMPRRRGILARNSGAILAQFWRNHS